jgi:DNA replication protein DnaC
MKCPYGLCDGSGFLIDEDKKAATDCRCRAQRIATAHARSLSAVIPRRFRDVAFERKPVLDMDPGVVRAVRHYVEDIAANLDAGRGLWLMGDVGTGKTTLAMLISKTALEAGRSVAIYSLPRLLAELRKTFDEDSDRSFLELLDRLAAVDLLHVDDLGAERTSPWVIEQLYSIVNSRYEEQRSMVVTTNLQREDLVEQIGERTVSRLTEMCDELPLFGHDRRETFAPVD